MRCSLRFLPLVLMSGVLIAAAPPYKVTKMPSGLEIVSLESHKVPLVTVVLTAKAGAMTESPDTNGLTHLWEHMFFKGNKRIPNQEAYNKRIRQLGITYNGDTSAEKVRYYFTLPSVFLEEGLQFMSDSISTPLLDQTELEKERRVVEDEYDRAAAQPGFDFHNLKRNMIYGKQAFQRDPLGLRPLIEKATREQMFKIKDDVFVPSNAALIVVGDFKPEQLQPLIEKHFSAWADPKGWKPLKSAAFPPFPKSESYVMTRANVQNSQVFITFNGPKARTEATDSFAADVLINLLDHRSGKFFKKFIDSGMTFESGVSYFTQSQAGEVDLYAACDPKNAKEVEKALIAESAEWAKPDYFTAAQLEDVRRKLLINHKREMNQPSDYAKTLAFWWSITGLDYYGGYLDNLQKIGLPEVQTFVKKYLVGKPHVGGILLSPQDAQKVGLKDSSGPLVEKFLKNYKIAPQSAKKAG